MSCAVDIAAEPNGVELHVRDDLGDLLLCYAVVDRTREMRDELLRTVGCNQRCDRDEAAVALRKTLALPEVAVEDVVRVIDQCRREIPDAVPLG